MLGKNLLVFLFFTFDATNGCIKVWKVFIVCTCIESAVLFIGGLTFAFHAYYILVFSFLRLISCGFH